MPNYTSLFMVVGDKIRYSSGCRQQAFSSPPLRSKINKKEIPIYFNQEILNKAHLLKHSWVKDFSTLIDSGYSFVTRIKVKNKTLVEKFLKTAGVDFCVLDEAAGFNSKAAGADSLAYILHCVGRDGRPVLSDDVPIPRSQVLYSQGSDVFAQEILADAFRLWIKKGMPKSKFLAEEGLLAEMSKGIKRKVTEVGKEEKIGGYTIHQSLVTFNKDILTAKLNDGRLRGGVIYFDMNLKDAGIKNKDQILRILSSNYIQIGPGSPDVITCRRVSSGYYGSSSKKVLPILNPEYVGFNCRR